MTEVVQPTHDTNSGALETYCICSVSSTTYRLAEIIAGVLRHLAYSTSYHYHINKKLCGNAAGITEHSGIQMSICDTLLEISSDRLIPAFPFDSPSLLAHKICSENNAG